MIGINGSTAAAAMLTQVCQLGYKGALMTVNGSIGAGREGPLRRFSCMN